MIFSLILRRLVTRTYLAVSDLSWWVLALCVLAHAVTAWMLLTWAGEEKLSEGLAFFYWYATTAYTVGYGDLSPQTDAGRVITAAYIFPGAIAAFTTIVAKTLQYVGQLVRSRRTGKGDYEGMTDTIVLIGYNPERTPKMIDELSADPDIRARLVLFTRKEITDPDPRVRYVRAASLTSPAELRRAGVETASRIAVYSDDDGQTLSAALAVAGMAKQAHVVCYFEDPDNADLLKLHCPQVECVIASGVELVVRSVQDPGSSQVLSALVSHLDQSATLFSLRWMGGSSTLRDIAAAFLDRGATLLACHRAGAQDPCFSLSSTEPVAAGDKLFYVADRRVSLEAA